MPAAAVEPVSDSPTGTSSTSEKCNGHKVAASPASSTSEITNTAPTVLVAGGGLCGLLAGVALAANGCDVHIFESSEQCESADAGVVVTPELQAFAKKYQVQGWKSNVAVCRQVLGHDGEPVLEDATQQRYTSWEVMYRGLRQSLPKDHFHRSDVVGVDTSNTDSVIVRLDTGERVVGHMLVIADGACSPAREGVLPGLQPQYAGYLAWQGVANVDHLPEEVAELLAGKTTMYKGINQHMAVHPVPLEVQGGVEGQAYLAWSWFNNQEAAEVPDLLVDEAGTSHQLSVPLGKLSPHVAMAVVTATSQALPPPLAALVANSTSCMSATAVSDLCCPRLALGRVALLGEAAALLRPHAGVSSGSQAAGAAMALADTLLSKQFSIDKALAAWEAKVLPHHVTSSKASMQAGDRLQGFEV